MKLEVGMYIRTKYSIFKYLGIDEKGNYRRTLKDDNKNITTAFDIDRVLKASYNIIDLVEVGDYVNGHLVKATYLNGVTKYIKLDNAYKNGDGVRTYSEDIKSIVTKELFEIAEYRIGE